MSTPENNVLTLAMIGKDDAEHLLALDALSCRLERERNEWKANHDKMVEEKRQAELLNVSLHMRIRMLESAIRYLRGCKGRYHSEMAYNKLVAMLPESKGAEL